MRFSSKEMAVMVYEELARRGLRLTGKYTIDVELKSLQEIKLEPTDFEVSFDFETKAIPNPTAQETP